MAKKPMIVVNPVKKIGTRLLRTPSAMAWLFGRPRRIPDRAVLTRCTLSATASVMIIVGATDEGAVTWMPVSAVVLRRYTARSEESID